MIGKIDPSKNKVTVVGAGISGLLIAYTLKKKGFEVEVFEASSRVGGLIQTQSTPYGPSEKAAHSLLVSEEIQGFFDELGIELLPVNANSKARFIVRNRKMRRLPLNLIEIVQTLFRFFSKPKRALNFETASLADWCKTYLGAPANRFLLSPFVTGVFAASPEELNAKISFPRLVPSSNDQSLFRFVRSKPKSKSPRPEMKVIRQGTETLVQKLAHALKDDITIGAPVSDITQYLDTNVIVTTPTSMTADLIEKFDATSAEKLRHVRYSPLITVTAFYAEADFKKPPRGVGVLIPRQQGFRVLGVLFNSSAFPERVTTHDDPLVSITVMLGGTMDPSALELSDVAIQEIIDFEMRDLLKATTAPSHLEITRWKRAIPVFSNELKDAQNSLADGFCSVPGRIVFSNFSKDVSIRGMIETVSKL